MTVLDYPSTAASLGVVGNRQLVAMQTVDIARLPIQPVVIIPSTFVAVSGWGPGQGSNESGKTSFQAAVALLCGDPEWWRSNVGPWSTGLLFLPDVAGDGTGTFDAARQGFIAGVFANTGTPDEDHVTVWLRISAESPHLLARWSRGVHFAPSREGADDAWRALPQGSEVGVQRYIDTMFGGSHRCLAWVTKRGTQPSRPSLLSMTVDKRRPQEIGADLLALTGRAEMLDRERDQRRKTADADGRRQMQREANAAAQDDEQNQLEQVERRDLARQRLDDGRAAWELHFARGLVDIRSSVARALLRRRQAQAEVATAQTAHLDATAELERLGDGSGLAAAADAARRRLEDLNGLHQQAIVEQAGISAERDGKTKRARELADQARQWDHTPIGELEAAKQAAEAAQARGYGDVAVAKSMRDDARNAYERLISGGSGAVAVLKQAGIDAVPLGDAVVVTDRARWEPVLHPWKEAALVADVDVLSALIALAKVPGSVLVHGAKDDTGALPGGIAAAPAHALPFLRALDDEWTAETDPERATRAHAQVVGGWAEEQLGADARRAKALAEMQEAEDLLAEEEATLKTASYRLQLSIDQLSWAHAHEERERLLSELEELETRLAAVGQKVSNAWGEAKAAQAVAVTAESAEQTFQERRSAAQRAVDSEAEAIRHAAAEVAARQRVADELTDRMRSYWVPGWRQGWRRARVALAGLPVMEVATYRKQASDKLAGALQALRIDMVTGRNAPNDAVRSVVDRRADLDDDDRLRAPFPFDRVAGPLTLHLAEWEETDRLVPERIAADRERRRRDLETIDREVTEQDAKLSDLRAALERDIERVFEEISDRYDMLDRTYGGHGARLSIRSTRPAGPDDPWVWEVEPQWKRSSAGRFVPYTRPMNDAQGKQHTIHLVLAALIATDDPAGRVLILDELGDKLDTENQRVLLQEIAEVARAEKVTVLGTCQDWLLEQAAQVGAVGQVIWFEYASRGDLLNRPTRMWGYDNNRERVALTADHLLIERPLL